MKALIAGLVLAAACLLAGMQGAGLSTLAPDEPPAPLREANVVIGAFRPYLVRFEDTVYNPSDVTLRDVTCEALLPVESARQRVRWLRLSDHAWTLCTDVHGQRVATAVVDEIPSQGAVTFAWLASVELAPLDSQIDAPVASLPDDVRRRHLADDRVLELDSAAVLATSRRLREEVGSDVPELLAEAALEHVRSEIVYELAGGWNPAPQVLARGSGSCSEQSFVLMALCRRLGVPARWIGGSLLRKGGPARRVDRSFHRMVEVWLPRRGWTALDPSVAPDAEKPAFGRVPRTFLVTARGDAGGNGGVGHAYHARESWYEPKRPPDTPPRGKTFKRATWFRGTEVLQVGAQPRDVSQAELFLADARGFGPPVTLDGVPIAPQHDEAARTFDVFEAGNRSLGLGHAGGILAIVETAHSQSAPGRRCAMRALAGTCDDDLREEALQLFDATPAEIAAWWRERVDRLD